MPKLSQQVKGQRSKLNAGFYIQSTTQGDGVGRQPKFYEKQPSENNFIIKMIVHPISLLHHLYRKACSWQSFYSMFQKTENVDLWCTALIMAIKRYFRLVPWNMTIFAIRIFANRIKVRILRRNHSELG